MRKRLLAAGLVILAAVLVIGACAAPTPKPTPAPAPAPTPAPAPAPTPAAKPAPPPTPAKPIQFSLAHHWPTSHAAQVYGANFFKEQIESRTKGKVTVTVYPNGALVGAKEIFKAVEAGTADLSLAFPPYWPGVFPVVDILSLPVIFPNAEVGARAVLKSKDKGYLDKELARVKLLGIGAAPLYKLYFVNTKVTK